ncbi:MAG: NUDIX hydrolase [Pseudomonadota bacterium]
MSRKVRLAVRGLLLHENKLLLVNAWPDGQSDLMCAPGGGVEPHASLPDNLIREMKEETGLDVTVHDQVLVNEFHDPARDFHQVDVYFRVTARVVNIPPNWQDPEQVVTTRRFVSREDLAHIRYKPDSLPAVAWNDAGAPSYDPLEPSLR